LSKEKKIRKQIMVNETLLRNLKIDQHEPNEDQEIIADVK